MTYEETVGLKCLGDLDNSIGFVLDDIYEASFMPTKKETLEELSWTLYAYNQLYSYIENNLDDFERAIGIFQEEMLACARRNIKLSRMFMFAFNVASEFLEYIYVVMEDE